MDEKLEFLHSGSTGIDCILGGGWARGRVCNIVGDYSTGKTLLALEAIANNVAEDPDAINRYAECEHAFATQHALDLGIPLDKIDFQEDLTTVEEFFADLKEFKDKVESPHAIYILDSLDSLSDMAEKKRDFGEASMGMNKAKAMSEMFRKLNGEVATKGITLFIISQIRDAIGGMVPNQKTRAGGRALNFYNSQVIWLTNKGKIERTVGGHKLSIGLDVGVECKKNKVGPPHRKLDRKSVV